MFFSALISEAVLNLLSEGKIGILTDEPRAAISAFSLSMSITPTFSKKAGLFRAGLIWMEASLLFYILVVSCLEGSSAVCCCGSLTFFIGSYGSYNSCTFFVVSVTISLVCLAGVSTEFYFVTTVI